MSVVIYCDACGNVVDKSGQANSFGALSIIQKEYIFSGKKIKNQDFQKQDFDFCSDCCTKILKIIEEIKASKEELIKK